MKLLITGSAGMLGTSIVPTLVAAGNEVVATDIDLTNPTPWGATGPKLDWLDIRDRSAVRAAFDTVAPDFVLHLAAETSLEASDDDPDHAYLTNTIATRYIALECRNRDVPMTFISTAGVFDGTKESGPYTEFDAPEPDQHLRRHQVRGREAGGRHPREVLHHPGRMDGGRRSRQGPQVRGPDPVAGA